MQKGDTLLIIRTFKVLLGRNTCIETISPQRLLPKKGKGVNQNHPASEEEFCQSWRGKLWQHQASHRKDLRSSGMPRAGRTLRNHKYRKVVENVHHRKQLFTPEIKKLLKDWLVKRRKHPYPSRNEKKELALKTGLTYMQICNWFANWRRKLRKNTSGVETWGRMGVETWGQLITGYNRQVRGNCEQFSISSHDSIWDEANYNHSESNPESSQVSRAVCSASETSLEHLQEEPTWRAISPWQSKSPVPERPATSVLVKWLESAARFRPREASWSPALSCWGGCPLLTSRKPRRARGRLRIIGKSKGRHREELDAAEALTFLSVAATLQS